MADLTEVPRAIHQMTVEEDAWRVHKIHDRGGLRLTCFGLDEDGEYRRRLLPGTDNEGRLAELSQLPGEPMSRLDALSLRESVDSQWRKRQAFKPLVRNLFDKGFFAHIEGDRLLGAVQIPGVGNKPPTVRTLAVYGDGTLMAQIQKEGELFDGEELLHRRYWMPRSTSIAYHDRKIAGELRVYRARVVEPVTILSAIEGHIKSIDQNLDHLVPKEGLDPRLVPSSPARAGSNFGLGDLDIAS